MYGASSMHLPTFSNAVFWVELFLIHIFSDLENYDAKYLIIEKSEKKTPRPPSHYLFVDRNLFVIQDELIASTDYNLSTTNRVMNENTLYNNKHIEDFLKI